MRERARLLVIQHEDDAPSAWFGEWFEAAGVALTVVLGHRGDPVPESVSEHDGLIVLGGEMGAYDDERFPWLTSTKQLISTTVRETPKAFLGICLGHQLAAVALGGRVDRNPAGRALGLTRVQLSDVGRSDPLLRSVGRGARSVQWNDDIVTVLPASSSVLAVAPDGTVQAARFGPRAWGVQFHPEVSPEVFASWGVNSDEPEQPAAVAQTIARVAREVGAAEPELRSTWRPLAERFAEIAASASATVP